MARRPRGTEENKSTEMLNERQENGEKKKKFSGISGKEERRQKLFLSVRWLKDLWDLKWRGTDSSHSPSFLCLLWTWECVDRLGEFWLNPTHRRYEVRLRLWIRWLQSWLRGEKGGERRQNGGGEDGGLGAGIGAQKNEVWRGECVEYKGGVKTKGSWAVYYQQCAEIGRRCSGSGEKI